jgi:hypothetical protein
MYGISDEEVLRRGRQSGWSRTRQMKSLLHPLRADFITPLRHLPLGQGIAAAPFLAAFTGLRYRFWLTTARKQVRTK